jgi:glycosyltransferase involved in cell wall biosynthesis/peptidoglycan/xylan/chitin deacetylase (PgdA/CDA1 family)
VPSRRARNSLPPDARVRVAHLGPDPALPGGIHAALRGLLASPLAERYEFEVIATYRDERPLPRLVVFARSLPALVRFCRGPGRRIVHIHMAARGSLYRKTICVAVAKLAGRRTLVQFHAGRVDLEQFNERIGPVRRWIFSKALRASDQVVSVSNEGGAALARCFGLQTPPVVPNPAPLAPQDAAERRGSSQEPEVLYLGGFEDPSKGGDVLVRALPELLGRWPAARFTLAGPADPPPALLALERENPTVRWAGWLDEQPKQDALGRCEVFVMPSLSEGLPVALLEAMVWGRAIVASNIGGIPEMVSRLEAALVAPGDIDALIEAVSALLADESERRRLGAAAHARALAFGEHEVSDRLDAFYRELAGIEGDHAGEEQKPSGPLRGRSRAAVFLCYHSIASGGPPFLSVDPDLFERQLGTLRRRGYRPGNVETLDRLADGDRPSGRYAFLTFDDGFLDNHATAMPLMQAYGFTGFLFVLPAHLDSGGPLDWPEVRAEAAEYPHLMRSLSWPLVEQMAEAGWEIGSHTLSHPHLPRLDDEALAQELLDSRRRIAERLGSCVTLAYPFGEWDERVARAARAAGYKFAFTLPFGAQGKAGPLSIPRVSIDQRDREWRLTAKLSPAGRSLLLSPLKPAVRSLLRRRPHRDWSGQPE